MLFKKENKKKEAQGKRIRITGGGQVLYEGKLEALPLREEIILAKSEEFFNDPDPCYIHRGAVSIRLYLELERAAEQKDMTPWRRYTLLEAAEDVQLLG